MAGIADGRRVRWWRNGRTVAPRRTATACRIGCRRIRRTLADGRTVADDTRPTAAEIADNSDTSNHSRGYLCMCPAVDPVGVPGGRAARPEIIEIHPLDGCRANVVSFSRLRQMEVVSQTETTKRDPEKNDFPPLQVCIPVCTYYLAGAGFYMEVVSHDENRDGGKDREGVRARCAPFQG